ncbi:hypothetical protein PoB_004270100 [Plakobranchus ocellatus]|uniref:Uncharacterized protein n=1 Tax=Plakobranchus ocellatus TaxID=259542 RepID=A0AAV4AYM1_9GAST|nr:hypothetical protein PoB_004270100 [Plakobranchus ocellatus]
MHNDMISGFRALLRPKSRWWVRTSNRRISVALRIKEVKENKGMYLVTHFSAHPVALNLEPQALRVGDFLMSPQGCVSLVSCCDEVHNKKICISGPSSGQGTGGGARTHDRMGFADRKADSLSTVLLTALEGVRHVGSSG